MRTQIQLDNIRAVLCQLVGGYAFWLTDEQVNHWANGIQKHLDQTKTWGIKIQTEEFIDKSWFDILFEPKYPRCDFQIISKKCYNLLEKYPKILAICIYNLDNHIETHVFTKGDIF